MTIPEPSLPNRDEKCARLPTTQRRGGLTRPHNRGLDVEIAGGQEVYVVLGDQRTRKFWHSVGVLLSCGKRASRPVVQGRCVLFSCLRRGREDGDDAFDVVLTFLFERSWSIVVIDLGLWEFECGSSRCTLTIYGISKIHSYLEDAHRAATRSFEERSVPAPGSPIRADASDYDTRAQVENINFCFFL